MTHEEIRDGIQQASLLPDEDTNRVIYEVLLALNDKIERLESEQESTNKVVRGLSDIHP